MRQSSQSTVPTKTAVQSVIECHPASQTPLSAAVPAALEAVALVDARTAAAAGSMSMSWWHESVAAGRAPAPVIRAPRCTRWRLADVRAFWQAFGSQADAATADKVKAAAAKASAAARAKRRAATGATSQVES